LHRMQIKVVLDAVEFRDDNAGFVCKRQSYAFKDRLKRLAVAAPRGVHFKKHVLGFIEHNVLHGVSCHNLDWSAVVGRGRFTLDPARGIALRRFLHEFGDGFSGEGQQAALEFSLVIRIGIAVYNNDGEVGLLYAEVAEGGGEF